VADLQTVFGIAMGTEVITLGMLVRAADFWHASKATAQVQTS
jgi:hypothetical protein